MDEKKIELQRLQREATVLFLSDHLFSARKLSPNDKEEREKLFGELATKPMIKRPSASDFSEFDFEGKRYMICLASGQILKEYSLASR